MVLASGLTSRKEPASFARRLLEAAVVGDVDILLTETLIAETRAVLQDPTFSGRLPDDLAGALLAGLRGIAAEVINDTDTASPRRTSDPDDDYLADAALSRGAMLVTRDDRAHFDLVPGLDVGRPGWALRRAGLMED